MVEVAGHAPDATERPHTDPTDATGTSRTATLVGLDVAISERVIRPPVVFGIDPGTTLSGFVLFDGTLLASGVERNDDILLRLSLVGSFQVVVIESIESFGMAVGQETFETVHWAGRFYERALRATPEVERITRRAVKLHLCGTSQAKDANIRQVVADRFGGSQAKGTKQHRGPLYGLASHAWSALALALVWCDQRG